MQFEEDRGRLVTRLQARRPELEQAALTRIQGLADPGETSDAEYMEGLRTAVGAALLYSIAALERSGDRALPIPTALLSQARLAARNRVGLDTVLRRYFAGYTLLTDFLIEEAEQVGPLRGAPLQRLLRSQATLLDRLLAAVSEEYCREQTGRPGSAAQRRAEYVKRLLAGELLDTAELAYDFEGWHIGVVASGPGAAEALEALIHAVDRRLLLVGQADGAVWAWLGSRHRPDPDELARFNSDGLPDQVSLALGEPGEGVCGWRLTHRQARAAHSIGLRGEETLVHYSEVALEAAVLGDELLAVSLRELYLAPLSEARDGGMVARETLRAYFAAERNVSSAAAALGVTRQTVTNRLHAFEDRVGRPLVECATEVEIALRLEGLGFRDLSEMVAGR